MKQRKEGWAVWVIGIALVIVTIINFATGTPVERSDAILFDKNNSETFICQDGIFQVDKISDSQYTLSCH